MRKQILLTSLLLGAVANAQASAITSSTDPSLVGASVLDFETSTPGAYQTFSQGGLTFTDQNGFAGIRIDGQTVGQYNTRGSQSLHVNDYADTLKTDSLRIDFSQPASAFGFLWGASNYQWTLSAYGAGNNLIESFALPITYASNAGDFFGIAAPGIAYAVLSTNLTNQDRADWVILDNVTVSSVSSVPLPAAVWLFGSALAGLTGLGFKRR
jgi:hypothetical protein